MLFPVYGKRQRFRELSRWSPRISTMAVDEGAPVDGSAISSIVDIGRDHANATQSSPVDQPIVDQMTVPGLNLLTFTETQHLQATQSETVRAVVIEFYVPADLQDQALISRATNAVTEKSAFEIGFA